MFDKLHSAFAKVAKSLSEKELNEKDIDGVLFDLEMSLLEADVASEVIDSIKADLKRDLIGTKVEKSEIAEVIRTSLISSISTLFDATGKIDVFNMINEKKKKTEPFLILFVGINGTGKTTSLAKFAYMLQQAKYSVVVAASDTFRAGAIEQLREHTKRLNLKIVAQNYNSDPAAVARDAVLYAKAHKTDCVLIDTAGRMQTSKNLMEQIAKITKVVNPDIKIFVGDSLAGNDTVNQAREFFEHTKFNASILTKADADARGGAALSIAKVTSTPIIYVGVGQEYQDLKPFDKNTFLNIVFGDIINDKSIYTAPLKTTKDTAKMQKSTQDADNKSKEEEENVLGEKKAKNKTEQLSSKSTLLASPTKPSEQSKVSQSSTASTTTEETSDNTSITESTKSKKPESTDTSSPTPPSIEPKSTKKPPSQSNDPFYGIADSDITEYSDKFDVLPPENDKDASNTADEIKKWIKSGRPDPNAKNTSMKDNSIPIQEKENTKKEDMNERIKNDQNEKHSNKHKGSKEDKKDRPKKERGMFGFFKK